MKTGAIGACLLTMFSPARGREKPACEFSDTVLTSPAEAPKRNRLVLLSTEPAAGQEVHPDTTIAVEVEYHIADFAPGVYELLVNFAELTPGSTKLVRDEGSQGRFLAQAQGRARLCAPIGGLYREQDLRWPLRMHVSLQKRTGPRSTLLYSETQRVSFPSPEVPARAQKRQKDAFTDEYYLALDAIFAFHEERVAEYKACVARLPDTAAALDAPYRAWNDKHAALFAQMDALQLEVFSEITRGTNESAAARLDGVRQEFADHMERQSDVGLRRRCSLLPIVLGADPREFVGRYITIVNEQVATRPPVGARTQ